MIFNCDILASVALLEEMMEWGDDVIQEVSVNVHDERPETDTVGKKKKSNDIDQHIGVNAAETR